MSCCGRPNNRANKEGAAGYYRKYAYLSTRQIEQAGKVVGHVGKCKYCDALTVGDPCTICGNPKEKKAENS